MAFEWDLTKEAANVAKHGVDFSTVPAAFDDPRRLILPDATHSGSEARFYCVGNNGRGILTVRFTLRGEHIRVIGAGYWRKPQQVYEKANH
jgi:hypothetical protein